uniref:Kelch domain containing 7A n=1 Tax=Erpetoichthys calabaricus TaxID=27687 RepID=A0A8C4S4A7_ERPCA
MPTKDLWGMQFDMQLLGKLSLSVVAVLLASWAYRFYSSRGRKPLSQDGETQVNGQGKEEVTDCCVGCNANLRQRKLNQKEEAEEVSKERAETDFVHHTKAMEAVNHKVLQPISKSHRDVEFTVPKKGSGEEELGSKGDNNDNCQVDPRDLPSKESFISSSDGQGVEEQVEVGEPLASKCNKDALQSTRILEVSSDQERSRSPALLTTVNSGLGVERELRENLEHPGSCFHFQSKAEIKVEDSSLVVEMPGVGRRQMHGKIYEYFIESASHSVSDDNTYQPSYSAPELAQYDDQMIHDACLEELEAKLKVERGSCWKGSNDPPSTANSIASPSIHLDSVFLDDFENGYKEEASGTLVDRSRHGSGRSRKESLSHIVENSELQISLRDLRSSSTPASSRLSSRTPSSEKLCFSPTGSARDPRDNDTNLDMFAGNSQTENVDSAELDILKCQLDLGNCLKALAMAQKHHLPELQEAAYKVMSDNYLQVLKDPTIYGRLRANEREQIQTRRLRGKKHLVVVDMDPQDYLDPRFQNPQDSSLRTSSRLYYYDNQNDSWHPLSSVPREVISKGCSMCTMDNYLFITAGCHGTNGKMKPSCKVFCFNPITGIWKEICPMNQARPQCKLVALHGYLYAIGGECLYTVERYDPRVDRWNFVAPLPNDTFAVAHRATACNGEIYVSGGTLRYTLLRYNPKTNTWKESLIMGNKERTADMVAIKSFIYRFDVNPALGISVYRYHAMAKLWYECCIKRIPYSATFQCAVIDNLVYCINRQFTMRFLADEVSPAFVEEKLTALPAAKGILFPLTLSLPEMVAVQTSV